MIKPSCFILGLLMVTGCGSLDVERSQPLDDSEVKPWEEGRFLGSDIFQFTFNREEAEDTAPAPVTETVNVNGYLWRASLDTVSFLPIASADPFGGLIITDWYTLPESSEERFRVNIYIRGRVLRTNALKVSVFRQVKDPQGQWVDRPAAQETALEIEEKILTTARNLRISAVQ